MIAQAAELGNFFFHQIFRFCEIRLPYFANMTIGQFLLGVLAANIAVWVWRYNNRENMEYHQPQSHMGGLNDGIFRRRNK